MMNIEKSVISHYSGLHTGQGTLAERIIAQAGGMESLTPETLAPYDEMHLGGRMATLHLTAALGAKSGMRVLDIGSGLGGAARTVAAETGAHVTGIDLTPDYCLTATVLSEMMDMGEMTAFEIGNATAMKFTDATFDAAYSIHTVMNIPDKQAVYNEAARVLKPGAALVIYDIMAEGDTGAMKYPLPWASAPDESFMATPDAVGAMLAAAGFTVEVRESRREFALAGLAKLMDRIISTQGAMRGPDFAVRITNLRDGIADGLCAPWQMVARKAP